MKARFLHLLIVALLLFSPKILPAEAEDSSTLNIFVFPQFFIDTLPGAYFYPSFFESFAPDTTILIEESNGFSLIDSPRVYFEGDSYTDFNWFCDGYNINSVLESGAPSILLPLSSIHEYALIGESPVSREYGLNFITQGLRKTYLKLWAANVWPNMKGSIPAATFFVSPHPTSEERNKFLYSERRKMLSNFFVDFALGQRFKESAFSLSLTYFDIERQFNDFSTFDETFKEKGKLFLMKSNYQREINEGFINITAAYNAQSRDRAFAELGRLPQETLDKSKKAFFAGIHLQRKRFNMRFSFCREVEDFVPMRWDYLKDLKDNDGEGFSSFEKLGSFSGNVFRLTMDDAYPLKQYIDTEIRLFTDMKYATIKGIENFFHYHPISFDDFPYLVILWNEGNEYRNSNAYARTGAIFRASFSQDFSLCTKFLIQYSSLRFLDSENNLSSLVFGYDIGVLFKKKSFNILLAYERMPYEIREDVNFFLEKQRPWGTYHLWNDINQDLEYQNGEEGSVFGFTGGKFHSIDENISTPFRKRFLLSFTKHISQKFSLNVKGIVKNVSNNFWVKFKDNPGFYEAVGDRELYFFSKPFADYVLSNSSFEENPFYFQFLLHVLGKDDQRWFFSISFMAHLGMGYTMFGNGPGANDIGVLDESQANPNTWINGYGRVDGDRAYVGKLYFGFYLAKNLFVAVNIKYRDGTPFAFVGSHYDHNQWVFYLTTIQAEDKRGVKGGPREDYLTDVSVRMRYDFRLFDWDVSVFGSVFNLLDFGSELSEYVFSGGLRYSNELQIPRSVRVGVRIEF